jgi:hypothetical protein
MHASGASNLLSLTILLDNSKKFRIRGCHPRFPGLRRAQRTTTTTTTIRRRRRRRRTTTTKMVTPRQRAVEKAKKERKKAAALAKKSVRGKANAKAVVRAKASAKVTAANARNRAGPPVVRSPPPVPKTSPRRKMPRSPTAGISKSPRNSQAAVAAAARMAQHIAANPQGKSNWVCQISQIRLICPKVSLLMQPPGPPQPLPRTNPPVGVGPNLDQRPQPLVSLHPQPL